MSTTEAGGARRSWWRVREQLGPVESRLLGLLPLVVILALWWLVTRDRVPGQVESRIIGTNILPSPAEMFARDTLRALWFDRELSRSALVSLGRVVAGFGLAVLVALPLGTAMGAIAQVGATFRPLTVAFGYLPVAALVPLTLVWFGIGEQQKVFFIALATFIYLLPLVVAAVEEVDDIYLQTAQCQGASRWQQITAVLLPLAWPAIYDSLRLGFGVAWSWIILAEVVAAERGLGFIINTAQGRGTNMAHVYLTLGTIVLLAFGLDRLWVAGQRVLFPYRRAAHG